MRHLVTGGSGFLGHLIIERLLAAGEQVRSLDVWRDEDLKDDVEFVKADVRDAAAVGKAMQGVAVVHHNAALVPASKGGDLYRQVNVEGARVAAQEAVKAGVEHFVHMSTSSLFGQATCPVTLETPYSPIEVYGQTKMEGEIAVREICGQARLPLVVIRPRTILGLGRLGIFQILFEWISEGRNVYVIGDGRHPYQFVHASDLMDAYMLALARGRAGVFNCGAAEFGTLRAALENVIAHAGTKSRVKALPVGLSVALLKALDKLSLSPLGPWHYLTYHKPLYFDVQPLTELGWRPQYSNDRMFAETYDWFLERRAALAGRAAQGGSPHRRALKQGLLRLLKWMS
jgi:nucleoside-diphosphate-sugar epimerase